MKVVSSEEQQSSSLPNGVVVERATYHQAYTINGVTDSTHYRSKGFNMVYTPEGLYGEFKGHKFIVPLSNIIVCHYA